MFGTLSIYSIYGELLSAQTVKIETAGRPDVQSDASLLVTLYSGETLWVSPARVSIPLPAVQCAARLLADETLTVEDMETLGVPADVLTAGRSWAHAIRIYRRDAARS